LPPSVSGTRETVGEGTGAQLYGLDAIWHLLPLLKLEATWLTRVVREPRPAWLTPGDTFVADGRVFGDRRGFRYAFDGAYEFGRVATSSNDADRASRTLRAFGLAAHASLETALPLHLTFGAEGAYASGGGDGKDVFADQTRFDPIFPDEREGVGKMGLWSWSNVIEAGGGITAQPGGEGSILPGHPDGGPPPPPERWTTPPPGPRGA